MSVSMGTSEKPPTLKSSAFRNWVRVNLLSPHLKSIALEEKTLDLACGWGFYFQINPNAFGIEIDDACVAHLQKEGYRVKRGSLLEPFPFEEGSFDNCLSHDVLEHFERWEIPIIFANAHRVLRPRQALEAGAYCVRLASNMGIATASMVGMACCVELDCQAMIRLDGDGQHFVADVDSLIRTWRSSGADLVTGSRYLRGDSYTSPLRQIGIVVLRFVLRWLYGVRVTDPTSGFRLYTRTAAMWFLRRQYPVDYPEAEELADLCLAGHFKIGEAVISANPRMEGTSSITPLRSGYFMLKVCASLLLRRVLVLWS